MAAVYYDKVTRAWERQHIGTQEIQNLTGNAMEST
jgi:hypothetical protein